MKTLSWTNVVLGLWLILAPFTLGYQARAGAVAEEVILGIIIAPLALWRAVAFDDPDLSPVSWVIALAGAWVMVAPYLFGYASLKAAMGNDLVVGLVVLILGVFTGSAEGFRASVA